MATPIPDPYPPSSQPTEESPLLDHTSEEHGIPKEDSSDQNVYREEFLGLVKYATPLILTQSLQYTSRLVSLVYVGHLGTIELGSLALALMTCSIVGYGPILGFATSLDTVCPEAFSSGRPHLVGLYCQRVTYMLLFISVITAVLWWFAEPVLGIFIPSKELVKMTAELIRIYIPSLPFYSLFEVVKRFVRCQGSNLPVFWVVALTFPVNVGLHHLFVHTFGWGVYGAAWALNCNHIMRPLLLLLYVPFSKLKQCWGGLSKRAFGNFRPLLALAIPDLIMVEVDVLSWEIITLMAAYLSENELAAQTALLSIMGVAFQIPFPFSVAASFRISSAIGAGMARRAIAATIVSIIGACVIGVLNVVVLIVFRKRYSKTLHYRSGECDVGRAGYVPSRRSTILRLLFSYYEWYLTRSCKTKDRKLRHDGDVLPRRLTDVGGHYICLWMEAVWALVSQRISAKCLPSIVSLTCCLGPGYLLASLGMFPLAE